MDFGLKKSAELPEQSKSREFAPDRQVNQLKSSTLDRPVKLHAKVRKLVDEYSVG